MRGYDSVRNRLLKKEGREERVLGNSDWRQCVRFPYTQGKEEDGNHTIIGTYRNRLYPPPQKHNELEIPS